MKSPSNHVIARNLLVILALFILPHVNASEPTLKKLWVSGEAILIEENTRLPLVLGTVQGAIPELIEENQGAIQALVKDMEFPDLTVFSVYEVNLKNETFYVVQMLPGKWTESDLEKAASEHTDTIIKKLAEMGEELEGCYPDGLGFYPLAFKWEQDHMTRLPMKKAPWSVLFNKSTPPDPEILKKAYEEFPPKK